MLLDNVIKLSSVRDYRGTVDSMMNAATCSTNPFEITKVVEPDGDNLVGNLDVLVHQDVSKSDGHAQCVREIGREYIVTAE